MRRQQRFAALDDEPAEKRRRDAVASLEQADAELIFEVLETAREGWLRHTKRLGRPAEVTMSRQGVNKLEVPN
ncbi:hypothetical protein LMG27198_37020 [Methylocystis echinoides]|uniref:Uncharacterized protein n=1 Tax=Methylocystis echinoides TaxID=29468 RepID=A0A9W6GXM6_9HYPH|nr:hypothetical protein [Methylocystis echinoides]GLI94710.1 hypothetical protein LMG27198_37020 [Methylocystis echinoides]